jgi:hypothetical protein
MGWISVHISVLNLRTCQSMKSTVSKTTLRRMDLNQDGYPVNLVRTLGKFSLLRMLRYIVIMAYNAILLRPTLPRCTSSWRQRAHFMVFFLDRIASPA